MGRNPRKGKKRPPWPSDQAVINGFWRQRNRIVKNRGCRCGGPSEWLHTVDGGSMGGWFEHWTCAEHAGVLDWTKVLGVPTPLWPRVRPCDQGCPGVHANIVYYLHQRAWFCTIKPSADDGFRVPDHGEHSVC